MPEYIPAEEDLSWARATINLLKEGGVLSFPSTGLVYVVSHEEKTLTRSMHLVDLPAAYETHRRTIIVFKAIGYEVKD